MTEVNTADRVVVSVTATDSGDWQVVSVPTGFQGIVATLFAENDYLHGFVRHEDGEQWEVYDFDGGDDSKLLQVTSISGTVTLARPATPYDSSRSDGARMDAGSGTHTMTLSIGSGTLKRIFRELSPFWKTFTSADASPSVAGYRFFKTNGTTAITRFDDMTNGQGFWVRWGGTDIVIQNNSDIVLIGGVNQTLSINNPAIYFAVESGVAKQMAGNLAPIDEDDFASDSALRSPSQQSTKAYIAAQIIDEDDFASDLATKSPSQQSTKAYIKDITDRTVRRFASKAAAEASAVLPSTTQYVELYGYNSAFDLDVPAVYKYVGSAPFTGNFSTGSAVITNIPSTSNLRSGMSVLCANVPAGRYIVSVDSSTQVTLNSGTSVTSGTGVAFTNHAQYLLIGGVYWEFFGGEITTLQAGCKQDYTAASATGTDDTTALYNAGQVAFALGIPLRISPVTGGRMIRTTTTIQWPSPFRMSGGSYRLSASDSSTTPASIMSGSVICFDHLLDGISFRDSANVSASYGFQIVSDIAFYRPQATPGVSWVPADTGYDIINEAKTEFRDCMWFCSSLAVKTRSGGITMLSNPRGQVLRDKAFYWERSPDTNQVNLAHLWPYWSQNAYVLTYTKGNVDPFYITRCDGLKFNDNFCFGYRRLLTHDDTALGGTTTTGTTTAGGAIITGIPSTAALSAGMQVVSSNIPVGRTIATVDSSTQVTLSSGTNVLAATSGTIRFVSAPAIGLTDFTAIGNSADYTGTLFKMVTNYYKAYGTIIGGALNADTGGSVHGDLHGMHFEGVVGGRLAIYNVYNKRCEASVIYASGALWNVAVHDIRIEGWGLDGLAPYAFVADTSAVIEIRSIGELGVGSGGSTKYFSETSSGEIRYTGRSTRTTTPSASTDQTTGVWRGHITLNTADGTAWLCTDATASAAVWKLLSGFYGFKANKNATDQTGVVSATTTKLTFSNAVYNTGAKFNASSSYRWTPPAHMVELKVRAHVKAAVVDQARCALRIYKNGTTIIAQSIINASGTDLAEMFTSVIDQANGTDYYEAFVNIAGTGDKTISGDIDLTTFEGRLI